MKRVKYFNYIEEKLGLLAYRINLKGRLNILDLHIHSENFYLCLLNNLFGWELENLNAVRQNIEAIDLIDHKNKLIVQVSATNTKYKVESTLRKKILKNYPGYTFKFVAISNEAAQLRKETFVNPSKLIFEPLNDIIDNKSILNYILSLDIIKQRSIYEFLKEELGGEIDFVKLNTNLALIIDILSKENLNIINDVEIDAYQINRKIEYNKINATKSIIDEFAIYYSLLNNKYSEFDKQGSNKSLSVLQYLKQSYIESSSNSKNKDPDSIFLEVIERVKVKVLESDNYVEIPIEELELCVKIIVVDGFIKCKIFENPKDYNYVIAG